MEAVAVAISMTRAEDRGADLPGTEQARQVLAGFRGRLYRCLTRRGDELFELGDAMLCADGPVQDLARLSLVAGHRRGHGAVYDALNAGRVDIGRLRWALAGLPLPAWPDGRIRLAVDVSPWLRPEAATSPGRLFCHVYGRGKGSAQMIPGWPYSVIAALEPGRTSWTAVLDAVRLRPDDDETEVTAAQVRNVITRLAEAGHWRDGDPAILVVFDAGYDVTPNRRPAHPYCLSPCCGHRRRWCWRFCAPTRACRSTRFSTSLRHNSLLLRCLQLFLSWRWRVACGRCRARIM